MAYDLQIGAATAYMEASGEADPNTRLGVCYVIANRWRSGRFGKTIAAVCFEPHQFSSWSYIGPNMERLAHVSDIDPELAACEQAMSDAIHCTVPDPTHGALYYFSDGIPTPSWAKALTQTARIGHETFFKG